MEMAEEGRVQSAQAQGQAFMFNAQENRDMATLDRMSGQESQARQDIANANAANAAATAGIMSSVTSVASAGLAGDAWDN